MTKDQALKLALEALQHEEDTGNDDAYKLERDAIKEALAQPEQEPVAWRALVSKFPQGTGSDWVYVTKPIMKDSVHNQPLYTTPPQRKPLSDEEIAETLTGYRLSDAIDITRAIEAAHGIKEEA